MSELADSIGEAVRKRVVSATLATYLFFWCVFHWEAIYTTLFTSQDIIYQKFGMLKNEYIDHYFFSWDGWITIFKYIIPAILTFIFIWLVPKYILIHAYRQEQRHKVDRRRVKLEEEENLEAKKEQLAIQSKKTLKAEIDTSKTEQKAASQDPTIIWQREYDKFKKSGLANILPDIAEAVYRGDGLVRKHYDEDASEWIGINLSKDAIAISHTNDLIVINNGIISLTEKGKYFLNQSYVDKLF